MAHFTEKQEQHAACILCPHRCPRLYRPACKKQDGSCDTYWVNNLRKSKKYHKQILVLCHWLYDEDLDYFKIKN